MEKKQRDRTSVSVSVQQTTTAKENIKGYRWAITSKRIEERKNVSTKGMADVSCFLHSTNLLKIMTKLNVYSFSDYRSVRFLAHDVKDGDSRSISRAAELMAHLVWCISDENSVLVPMPGRTGSALYTKVLAEKISELTGIQCLDCLACKPHMTQYNRKRKYGIRKMSLLHLFLTSDVPSDKRPILIDNVLDTGTTAVSAMLALNTAADIVVLGNTDNFRLFNYPISMYERSLALQ